MMDIVCNIDSNYIKYCVVMLTSLFENNKEEITVHIIAGKLEEYEKQLILDSLERYRQQIRFYDAGEELLSLCSTNGDEGLQHISIATYYRIFLPQILPASVSKVLYLDCDLIVMRPLKEFWETDLTNHAVAAVEDNIFQADEHYERLRYDRKYSYFNAGVLLINLDYWRAHRVVEQAVEYIRTYPERLKFNDQDVLNAVLHDKRLPVSFAWNMQEGFYLRRRFIHPSVWKELDALLPRPGILHYAGKIKPWQPHYDYRLAKQWFYYLDKTPWKGERPAAGPEDYYKRYLQPALVCLHLDKPRYRYVRFKK